MSSILRFQVRVEGAVCHGLNGGTWLPCALITVGTNQIEGMSVISNCNSPVPSCLDPRVRDTCQDRVWFPEDTLEEDLRWATQVWAWLLGASRELEDLLDLMDMGLDLTDPDPGVRPDLLLADRR